MQSTRTLNQSTAGADERAALIQRAGCIWDNEPSIQRRCRRADFIDGTLSLARQPLLTSGEQRQAPIPQSGPGGNRIELIRTLARQWDESPDLRSASSREGYVDGFLSVTGLPKTTDMERTAL